MRAPLDLQAERNHIRADLSVGKKFNSLLGATRIVAEATVVCFAP
jgi:hypothetical protein